MSGKPWHVYLRLFHVNIRKAVGEVHVSLFKGGSDFTIIDETVTFLPGDHVGSSRCVNIMINDDTEEEGDESFRVIITSSLAEVTSDAITTTIIDDDDVGRYEVILHL